MTFTRLYIIAIVVLLAAGYGANWLALEIHAALEADRAAVELSIDE